ncbi:hypothetical protein EVAR_23501_1 [Eumeta japonica]|uniref:Uncharacterized protein n=1 Tax=Eumeta variegata TaxID=151549 RepID=A0A4C1W151_EUMVA|nr:hypothetical protein EVAR_23501_1 [Eumeta japonica]
MRNSKHPPELRPRGAGAGASLCRGDLTDLLSAAAAGAPKSAIRNNVLYYNLRNKVNFNLNFTTCHEQAAYLNIALMSGVPLNLNCIESFHGLVTVIVSPSLPVEAGTPRRWMFNLRNKKENSVKRARGNPHPRIKLYSDFVQKFEIWRRRS